MLQVGLAVWVPASLIILVRKCNEMPLSSLAYTDTLFTSEKGCCSVASEEEEEAAEAAAAAAAARRALILAKYLNSVFSVGEMGWVGSSGQAVKLKTFFGAKSK